MKTRINVLLATAGIATVLLTGCVSSKKYKSSQAALQQVRNDSARLAQQVASLNENVHSLEQKSTTLQRSLDSASSSYASQQKSLDYYQSYFNKQQSSMSQISEELKSALSQAGLTNEAVQQANEAIYVSLDENNIFKKNSTAVTPKGKQALNSLAQVIKNRSDVNVTVTDGASSTGQSGTTGNEPSSSVRENAANAPSGNVSANDNMSANPTPRRRPSNHAAATRRSVARNANASGNRSNATRNERAQTEAARPANETAATNTKTQNSGKDNVAVARKRTHRKYSTSEGPMRFSVNGSNSSRSRSWALKQGRVNTVANSLLQNGVPKVNVLLQQPASNGNAGGQNNTIKVIVTPAMSDFNPQKNSSAKVD